MATSPPLPKPKSSDAPAPAATTERPPHPPQPDHTPSGVRPTPPALGPRSTLPGLPVLHTDGKFYIDGVPATPENIAQRGQYYGIPHTATATVNPQGPPSSRLPAAQESTRSDMTPSFQKVEGTPVSGPASQRLQPPESRRRLSAPPPAESTSTRFGSPLFEAAQRKQAEEEEARKKAEAAEREKKRAFKGASGKNSGAIPSLLFLLGIAAVGTGAYFQLDKSMHAIDHLNKNQILNNIQARLKQATETPPPPPISASASAKPGAGKPPAKNRGR